MRKTDKIYVAGHNGMVGSAIVRALKQKGFANLVYRTSKELDLRDQAAVERFFKDEKPQFVFLAAAKVGGIVANNTYRSMITPALLLVIAARRKRPRSLVSAPTAGATSLGFVLRLAGFRLAKDGA